MGRLIVTRNRYVFLRVGRVYLRHWAERTWFGHWFLGMYEKGWDKPYLVSVKLIEVNNDS